MKETKILFPLLCGLSVLSMAESHPLKLNLTRQEDLRYADMLPSVKLLDDSFDYGKFSMLDGVRTTVVQLPTRDWNFQHESAIMEYHGTLFASWYNCPVKELTDSTPIRGRRSQDGGRTWSDVEILGQDAQGKLLYCPPVYGIDNDQLYLFMNTMVAADMIHSLELHRYNEKTGKFEFLWSRPIPFKLNTNVYRLPNGKLLLSGRVGEMDKFPTTPAVMISDSGRIDAEWRVVRMQKDGLLADGVRIGHAETSIVALKDRIVAFCREDAHNVPLLYESLDNGETWSGPFAHDIPLSNSKIYSGTLSDGRNYVIGNLQPGRSRLAILFTEPGKLTFTTGGYLRSGYDQRLDLHPQWSYPVAHEANGKLYVIYTMEKHGLVNGRGAMLSVIDLKKAFAHKEENSQMEYSEAYDSAAYALNLWPEGKTPGVVPTTPEYLKSHDNNTLRITSFTKPAIYVYPSANARKPAPCMVVCPGGGYSYLAWDKEGTEIADFLVANGVTAVVLKYRCPDNRDGAFQDAQRAIRQIRAHAQEWNINPNAVGIMGFSAGGHLAVRAACRSNTVSYQPIDDIDKLSARPDFAVPVYPAYLNAGNDVAPDLLPLENLPPFLVIHNNDDIHFVPGSRIFTKAVGEAGFDCCFRHYAKGGHGYGLRSKESVKDWCRAMILWFHEKHIL